jgi:hypothetical protein
MCFTPRLGDVDVPTDADAARGLLEFDRGPIAAPRCVVETNRK